jgi:hypothetical protein
VRVCIADLASSSIELCRTVFNQYPLSFNSKPFVLILDSLSQTFVLLMFALEERKDDQTD